MGKSESDWAKTYSLESDFTQDTTATIPLSSLRHYGAVSMCGNSWLATELRATEITKRPSLKCIAPWEAFTNKYRDLICFRGVPKMISASLVFNKTFRGRKEREDISAALTKWPHFNEYRADKVYDTSKLTLPIYALASYASEDHGQGTVRG